MHSSRLHQLKVTKRCMLSQVVRDKNVIKPAKGKRKCNCKNKVVTRQVGPGMYQQYTQQECEDCQNVKLARESLELSITVDPGTHNGQVFNDCAGSNPCFHAP